MIKLTEEQQNFIDIAKFGCNILVDACIGSGKTTTIQQFCREISYFLQIERECEELGIHFRSKDYPTDETDEFHCPKKVLYLTYNASLKDEARRKIKISNIDVHSYNSFTVPFIEKGTALKKQITRFLDLKPKIPKYDILIIDEYQDIKEEHEDLLKYIKSKNPDIQILAVGDMKQKVYDYTRAKPFEFIKEYLGEYKPLEFTKCFRLNKEYAARLGKIWEKDIVGVNKDCKIQTMSKDAVVNFLLDKKPGDILCLGANTGTRTYILNKLEELKPDKFNKNTVFSKITDGESIQAIRDGVAIFCTYDSCKGLEKDICVITNFTEEYWEIRSHYDISYEILRNIFLVAASRGKKHIIFVKDNKNTLIDLNGKTLSTPFDDYLFENVDISKMYDFKFKEDIDELYSCLKINEIKQKDTTEIEVNNADGYIDLSPCIGLYQEYMFFSDTDIDMKIIWLHQNNDFYTFMFGELMGGESLEEKILHLTAMETEVYRYKNQVKIPFISDEAKHKIFKRLQTRFNRYEEVQEYCEIPFYSKDGDLLFTAKGLLDVLKNDIVYELKFVSGLANEHFLQCATYVYATGKEKGILWNTKKNEMYEIKIPNRDKFADLMAKAITKGRLEKYYKANKKIIILTH